MDVLFQVVESIEYYLNVSLQPHFSNCWRDLNWLLTCFSGLLEELWLVSHHLPLFESLKSFLLTNLFTVVLSCGTYRWYFHYQSAGISRADRKQCLYPLQYNMFSETGEKLRAGWATRVWIKPLCRWQRCHYPLGKEYCVGCNVVLLSVFERCHLGPFPDLFTFISFKFCSTFRFEPISDKLVRVNWNPRQVFITFLGNLDSF